MAQTILNRKEFIAKFNEIMRNHGDVEHDDHPLWIPEFFEPNIRTVCNWFIMVKPVDIRGSTKEKFWAWCNEILNGELLCYSSSSDEQEEWWGFTCKDDIMIWVLKWA